jgi:2,4-dienoyl-CoA reductase-like NADH-dependent reductase (Old Yellow Enzyme family)
MPVCFSPLDIGRIEVRNRFVHSATFESMAAESGDVTEKILKRYRRLASGEVGLIIPGAFYVSRTGRVNRYQMGIHEDRLVPCIKELVDTVHEGGSAIVLQLVHAGGQTKKELTGVDPIAPSGGRRDPVYLTKPRQMTGDDIERTIAEYRDAARRGAEAGADGVQLHAAHGILINQFLSPFYNRRSDEWGGSDENRFRFLGEVVAGIQDVVSKDFPILVKLSSNDFTPEPGITPELAARYAGWLADAGVAAVEISCGTGSYSNMNIWRGDVPIGDLVAGLPLWQKPIGWLMLRRMVGRFDLEEGYNLEAARTIKPAMGSTPLMLVGGLRRLDHIEGILAGGAAEFASMSRPLIREPNLVKRFRLGRTDAASCVSCNKCLAATVNNLEVRCYYHPGGKERRRKKE